MLKTAEQAVTRMMEVLQDKENGRHAVLAALPPLLAKAAHEYKESIHEYKESIKDGRFVEVEEYQDARGFILNARDEILSAGPTLRRRDAEAYAGLVVLFDEIAAVMAAPAPSGPPTVSPSEIHGRIARIELFLKKLK